MKWRYKGITIIIHDDGIFRFVYKGKTYHYTTLVGAYHKIDELSETTN